MSKNEYIEGVKLHDHAVTLRKEADNKWSIDTVQLLDFDDFSKGACYKSNYEVYDIDHARAVYKREVEYLEKYKEAQPQLAPKAMAMLLDCMVMVDKEFPDGLPLD